MTTILQINASARTQGAQSTLLANELVSQLLIKHPGANLVQRNLVNTPVTTLDEAALGALFSPADQRTPQQQALVDEYDALIAEIQAADIVVFGVPMYNFSVPVQLKAYLDAIARVGVTFRYTANGAEGLIKGKKVYVVFARGGVYRATPADSQTPFMQQILAFLGMTDVEYIFAEGLNMGPEAQQAGLANAREAIAAI